MKWLTQLMIHCAIFGVIHYPILLPVAILLPSAISIVCNVSWCATMNLTLLMTQWNPGVLTSTPTTGGHQCIVQSKLSVKCSLLETEASTLLSHSDY